MTRLLSIAALIFSAAALALAAFSPGERPAAAPPSGPDLHGLQLRVETLEDTVQALSAQIHSLEQRPGATTAGADAPAAATPELAAEVAQLRERLQGVIAGGALGSDEGRAVLKDTVRTVQEELATQRRQEQVQRMVQAEARNGQQRLDRWKQFVGEQHLDYPQEQELLRRMTEENTRRQTALESMRNGEGEPRDGFRDLRQLRRENDQAMQKLLSADQYAQYQQERREDRPRSGGGGGGGRGGRPGRGGGGQQ